MAESRLCSITDCGKTARKKGMCIAHYERLRIHGDPLGGSSMRNRNHSPLCSVDGCEKPFRSSGLCHMHYMRWHVRGDTDTYFGAPMAFLNSVVFPYEGDDCIKWPHAKTGLGYGRITIDGNQLMVGRVICEATHGPPPTPKHQAAHSCGNGHLGCVTKNHLSWKTPKGNQADRITHGTALRGEGIASAKLSERQVTEIMALKGSRLLKEIAAEYKVTESAICSIHVGKTWRWLTGL